MGSQPDPTRWPLAEGLDVAAQYARYAAVYDLLLSPDSEDLPFYQARVQRLVAPGATVLELGVGTGRHAEPLLGAGYRVIGIDLSVEMLAAAARRLAGLGRYRLVLADLATMELGEVAALAVAPYGLVGHLVTNAQRLAVFRQILAHLEPGGWFIFDDKPNWLTRRCDGSELVEVAKAHDPATGLTVRLQTNVLDVADQPLTVCYDIIDWLAAGQVVRREIIPLVFRNIAVNDELALLRAAGFEVVELLGGFDGRQFDHTRPEANRRLVVIARRPVAG